MALLQYFQASDKSNYKLPDPRSPLSRVVPVLSIASAKKVKSLIDKKHTSGRQSYVKVCPELKAKIGKRAATIRLKGLKESSFRTWRNGYIREMEVTLR